MAWLIQRPKNNVQHEVHLQVLVFAGRSPTDVAAVEQAFLAVATDYFRDVEPEAEVADDRPMSTAMQPGRR